MSIFLIALNLMMASTNNIAPSAVPIETFESLKAAFEAAKPAEMKDYPRISDLYTSNSKVQCISIGMGNIRTTPGASYYVYVGRFDYMTDGVNDTPGKVVTTLSPVMAASTYPPPQVSNNDVIATLAYGRLSMPVTSKNSAGDLQAVVKGLAPQYDDYVDVTIYRKSGNNLYFHEYGSSVKNNWNSDVYGQCFTK